VPLSIKNRIRVFQFVAAITLAAMAALALINLRISNSQLDRVQSAREQLVATTQVAISANRFSEQIAELLLIGEPERPDFDSARTQVREALAHLRLITVQGAAEAADATAQGDENVELEKLDRMEGFLRQIDRAVERLLLLDQEGRRAEAIALFRSEIENRLDAEFTDLISTTLDDTQADVRRVEAEGARLSRWVTAATLAGLAAVIAATVVTGFLFARSIETPIRRLTEGTVAIEQGELGHRIQALGQCELSLLAERFNAMAEQLERQHALLVGAQGRLEAQVAERTAELAEANRQLTKADRQRVHFLGDISHELRTPLAALRAEAELALRGSRKPEEVYREALLTVVARSGEMTRLVEDLLFDMRRVDAAEVVAGAVSDAAVVARERKVQVGLSPESMPVPVLVRGDPRRLKQAVMITLDNAIKYARPGGHVEVAVGLAADDRELAEVTVRDDGEGIPPEDIPRVFERFFRGSNARERWEGGSGLGLSIARWIVEKHGGSIELSSALGEGTEVRFRLPVVR
jgi:two-component system OmpR family sensor kinase